MTNLSGSGPWRLKGEGNAGAVFAYLGEDAELIGKVLKVTKLSGNGSIPNSLEPHIWSIVPGLVGSGGKIKDLAFPELVMRPLIGAGFVGNHVTVEVPAELSSTLLAQIRAKGRQPAPQHLRQTALLLPDYTLLPPTTDDASSEGGSLATIRLPKSEVSVAACVPLSEGGESAQRSLAIEIKPKCGFLPEAATIHPRNSVKKARSRFTLQQQLKLDQGSITSRSEYDPLDLFSGDRSRACHALRCLLREPQNNLRFFIDGVAANLDQVRRLVAAEPGEPDVDADAFLAELVAGIMLESGVLSSILKVQKLDTFDIEGVAVLYHRLTAQSQVVNGVHPPPTTSHANKEGVACQEAEHGKAIAQLLALPDVDALAIIRDYLIAATAKDCSIMVACRPCPNRQSSESELYTVYEYQVRVADLDLKAASKIVSHREVVAEIVARHTALNG